MSVRLIAFVLLLTALFGIALGNASRPAGPDPRLPIFIINTATRG